jgi:hypothetical protein
MKDNVFRTILVGIILLVLCSVPGCTEQDTESAQGIPDIELEQQVASLAGTRDSFDRDGDGQAEVHTLSYDPVEVAPDVMLEQRIEYVVTDEGFDGTIFLEFEISGDTDELTYVEVIPKVYAQSVDDLTFSIPPDRIIKPDPEVEWNFRFEKGSISIIGIEIRAQGKAPVVEVFDAFDRTKSFNLCDSLPVESRDICYLAAVGKLKKPALSDCDGISDFAFRESCISIVAIAQDDHTICTQNIKTPDIKAQCYLAFAIAKGDASFCEKIEDPSERKICQLAFEAHQRNKSFEEIYAEKLKEAEGQEQAILDVLVEPDDDEKVTGKQYTFNAVLDPPDLIPQNAVYEFVFEDGVTKKSSSNRLAREFKTPGSYTLTVTLSDAAGKMVAKKTLVITVEKGEEKEEETAGLSADDCLERGRACADDCNQKCEQAKGEYCKKYGYSGCALDVFCWCNVCGIYDTKWCPIYPEYLSCAEGAAGTYIGCIESCQAKREAGSDVSTCWADCNEVLNNEIIACKQGPCQEFCEDRGFSNGEWARYTQEFGWDSCYCTNQ